jgi:hypothetical protein
MKIKPLGLAVMFAALLTTQQAAAAVHSFACDVREVATLHNRVHLLCNIQGYLMYLAVPTSSPDEAQRLLAMGNAALTAPPGQTFWVTYDVTDYQGTAYGCLAKDCRRPLAFFFRK